MTYANRQLIWRCTSADDRKWHDSEERRSAASAGSYSRVEENAEYYG